LKEIGAKRSVMVQEQKARGARVEEYKKRQQTFKDYVESTGLPYKQFWAEDFQQKNFELIDDKKRLLQQQFERRQLSTIEEKALVKKIAEIERRKAIVREVMKKKVELDARRPEDKKADEEAWDSLKAQQTQATAELDKLSAQITQNEAQVIDMLSEIKSIREQLQALSEKWTKQQQALTNKKEADREAYKLKIEQEKIERAARVAEQKKRQEEKARQASLVLPYEQELDVANTLISHLKSLSKMKKGDKIAHPLRVYAGFEILAVAPPLSPPEVEACLATVQAKYDFFKSQRRAKKAQQALAEKERLEAANAAASAPSPVDPRAANAQPEPEASTTEEAANPTPSPEPAVEEAPAAEQEQQAEAEPTSNSTETATPVEEEGDE